jgi:hypothetical protein
MPGRCGGFAVEGGARVTTIWSLLSLISYFGQGEVRERYLGVKIPPTNLKPDFLGQAQVFANRLADGLGPARPRRTTPGG